MQKQAFIRKSWCEIYTNGKREKNRFHQIVQKPFVSSSSEFGAYPQWVCENGTCCWCRTSRDPDWQSFLSSDIASSSQSPWKRWGARVRRRHSACLLLPACRALRMGPGQSPNSHWENTHNPPAGWNRRVKQSWHILYINGLFRGSITHGACVSEHSGMQWMSPAETSMQCEV